MQDWPSSGTRKDDSGNQVGDGFAFEFVDILREKFGFSYDIVVPEENVLGDATRGVFGLLHSKVSAGPFGLPLGLRAVTQCGMWSGGRLSCSFCA